jgi:polyisoprenoid-binding protein YceI
MPVPIRPLRSAYALVLAALLPAGLAIRAAAPAATPAAEARPAAAVETYVIDPVHSKAQFDISHLLVSSVSGRFTRFKGTILLDKANLAASSVEVTIDAASVNTDMDMRDKDLRGANFFDVARFPTITFRSTAVEDLGGGNLKVAGQLTIHGKTEPVVIAVSGWRTGSGAKPGVMLAGFRKGTLTIKRSTFGMDYLLGVAGDEVDITLSVEAARTQPAP